MLYKITRPVTIAQNFALIPLTHGRVAIIDPDMLEFLSQWTWKAVRSSHCWYAVRDYVEDGIYHRVRMHRVIAKTPYGQITHHKNHRSLDNRIRNLENLLQTDHQALHDGPRHRTY